MCVNHIISMTMIFFDILLVFTFSLFLIYFILLVFFFYRHIMISFFFHILSFGFSFLLINSCIYLLLALFIFLYCFQNNLSLYLVLHLCFFDNSCVIHFLYTVKTIYKTATLPIKIELFIMLIASSLLICQKSIL